MKNQITFMTFAGLVAGLLMAPHANAQCPAQALTALSGKWAFSTDGFSVPNFQFLASGGVFVATVGADRNGNPIGLLTVTQTSANNGSITRLETDPGRYQLNADCTGGTLMFNLGGSQIQFDFFFVNAGEMVVVAGSNGDVVTGTARLVTAPACSGNALGAIAGTWVFSVEGFDLQRSFPEVASAGRFVAAGSVLNVTQTAGAFGGNVRLETDTGTVQTNSDCSGGSMSFSISGRPIQFDFFFANANRFVLIGSIDGDIITGEARRFGSTDQVPLVGRVSHPLAGPDWADRRDPLVLAVTSTAS